jgi:ketosteroid isomerase-like protein
MFKLLSLMGMVLGLFLASLFQTRQSARDACIERCYADPGDPEVQRQEIVSLEKEAARAIQLGDATFFRRVYNDDFTATLSHGQQIDKNQWIRIIQSPTTKYDNFVASDITVHIFQDTAVATTLWSSRRRVKGEVLGHQMRTIHVYINTPRGWHVVSGQTTNLPPDVQHDL